MARFTLLQLIVLIGAVVFLFQVAMIRIDTRRMLENTEMLSDSIKMVLQAQQVNSHQLGPPQGPPMFQMGPPVLPVLPPAPPPLPLNLDSKTKVNPVAKKYKGRKLITSRLFGITARAGLGNQLFELVSLAGIASQLNRTPYLNVASTDLIITVIQSILPRYPLLLEPFLLKFDYQGSQLVSFNVPMCCKYDNVSRLKFFEDHSLFLDGVWFQSYKYFHHMRDKVRKWLTPHPMIAQTAKDLVPTKMLQSSVICVHARRGDFVTDGYHKPSDEKFTIAATRLMGRKSSVVVMGNDPLWAQLLFMDFVNSKVVANSNPEQDFSLSQQVCDTVLITAPSSTFGFWLAYLAKEGAEVYYRDIFETGELVIKEFEPTDFFPPNWTKLKFLDGKVTI